MLSDLLVSREKREEVLQQMQPQRVKAVMI